MPKAALVLGGGGAWGAFQAAAAKYAHEVKDYEWSTIRGVSCGAVNGALIAQGRYRELDQLWHRIERDDVYRGTLLGGLLWRVLIRGERSIYDLTPLWRTIERYVDPAAIVTPIEVGVTSLFSGEYVSFTGDGPSFRRAVLASATLPVLWGPIYDLPEAADAVDGGVRNITPLKEVIAEDPDKIVVINCGPRDRPPFPPTRASDIVTVAVRTLATAMHEIFLNDVNECLKINDLVRQAEDQDAVLRHENGRPYRVIDVTVIEPVEPLGDWLDFSREAIDRCWDTGIERAREVLGP